MARAVAMSLMTQRNKISYPDHATALPPCLTYLTVDTDDLSGFSVSVHSLVHSSDSTEVVCTLTHYKVLEFGFWSGRTQTIEV